MTTRSLHWLTLLATLCFGHQAAVAETEFSADMVLKSDGETQVMRYYKGKQKMRTETNMEDGRKIVSIIDIQASKMITLMPDTRTYMEIEGIDESQDWFNDDFLNAEDLDDEDYETKKVGTEKVNGYVCDKYVSIPKKPDLEKSTTWFSRKLGFAVKSVSPSDSMELTNIKEGSQPASLFTVPKGYQKMPGMGDYFQGRTSREESDNAPRPSTRRQPSVIEEDASEIGQDARNEVKNATKDEISDSIRKGIRSLFGKD
jgi:outer membrane lipoprotein-sorting protein